LSNIINQFTKLKKRGALYIFAGTFITKFVAFFGSIFLVRVLSKEEFGMLSYIENIYSYVYIIAGMGLANSILRYVILGKSVEEKYGYYLYALKKGLLFNFILIIGAALIVYFFPHPDSLKSTRWLIILVIMMLPFQHLIDDNLYTIRAMFDNKRYAISSFMFTFTLITSRYLGAILWNLKGVIAAKMFINIFWGMILCFTTYKLYFRKIKPTTLSYVDRRTVDKYSIQYMITNGIWAIFMLNDVFLLGQLCGDSTVLADYKVAYVLPGNLSILSTAIGVFIGPYFVRHENDNEWVRKNYLRTYRITASLVGFSAIILYIFAKPIITILYGLEYINVIPIMRLLTIAAFINSGLRFTTAHVMASMGQIKYNMIVSFLGMLIQISANIFIIPIFGTVGVAWTSIGVYLFMAVVLFVIFAKKYDLKALKI